MSNHTNVNIGNAGEYFVAGELERRGFTVAVPMSNVKDFDILAINRQTYEQFAIQVKTTGYKQKRWTLSQKNEKLVGDNIVYVFVALNELETPEYHIVPSKVVAETITESHRKWLETPGKNGQTHNDTSIRNFFDVEDTYLDRWDILDGKRNEKAGGEKYRVLTDFIPKLQNIEYGKVQPETQTGDGSMERPFTMPYVVYTDVVNDFVKAVYHFEKEHPEYGLNRYKNILEENGLEWSDSSMKGADVSKMDGKGVMALLIAAIRAERFCDGALLDFLKSGFVQKWLERLEELDNE